LLKTWHLKISEMKEEVGGLSLQKEMGTLKTVRIIHEIFHRMDYIYLAEAFRFLGIFVCEEILMEGLGKSQADSDTECDAVIFVGSTELSEKEAGKLGVAAKEYESCVQQMTEGSEVIFFESCLKSVQNEGAIRHLTVAGDGFFPIPLEQSLSKEEQVELYCSILTEISKICSGMEINAQEDSWKRLFDVFVENKLMFHSMNLQYYTKRPSRAAADAKAAFIEGYQGLKKLGPTISGDVLMHCRYAKLWCAVKANMACDYQGDILYFPIEYLEEECKKLCKEYEAFDNARVLLGLCYEPALSYGNEALIAFDGALQKMGAVCFASPVYYWMGKRFESYSGRKKDAEICYKKANDRKEKFRNIFKLAVIERDRKEYDKSLELFDKILSKLQKKLEMEFADPLELEYAFKVYMQESYIYFQKGNYDRTIEMGKRAIEIKEEKIKQNKFFPIFYDQDAEGYKEILQKRLKPKTAYQLLAESYYQLEEEGEAEKYRNKLRKLKQE